MIYVVCTHCSFTLEAAANDEESERAASQRNFWPDKHNCLRCDRPVLVLQREEISPEIYARLAITTVSLQEALAASYGLGLPTERCCSKKELEELFSKNKIVRVTAQDLPGTQRCTVDCLHLEDGTKIYLGAGPVGALVYRITRPHSYVEAFDGSDS